MSKISYHSKRSGGPSYPNYSYSNYIGYNHSYKKNYNYFKPRQKYTNVPVNNYFEDRNKNYIYLIFSKKNIYLIDIPHISPRRIKSKKN